jgi:hypothetical protein
LGWQNTSEPMVTILKGKRHRYVLRGADALQDSRALHELVINNNRRNTNLYDKNDYDRIG